MTLRFKPETTPVTPPPAPSPEQVKAANLRRTVADIQRLLDAAYTALYGRPGNTPSPQVVPVSVPAVGIMRGVGAMVWQNPYGLTPAEVFAALDTSAGRLFTIAAWLAQGSAIIGDEAPSIVPPEYANRYQVSATGVVTITS